MKKAICISFVLSLSACATYYHANLEFNDEFERGDLRKALSTLRAKSSDASGKKQFLYFVNNGLILSLIGEYKESNDYFEKAYLFGEDYRINYLNEAVSYLSNPNFTTYRGEDHEHLILLYFKALNYLKLGQTEEALVECRRMDLRLKQLTDRYDSPNAYRRDGFIHTLMGIIYDADRDYNNAFIAYRNALEVYEGDFTELFGVGAPQQLKEDALRTAFLAGMTDEYESIRMRYQLEPYIPPPVEGQQLVFFWHNGLTPVKAEWGVNFWITRRDNIIWFTNPELGLSFPFDAGSYDEKDRRGLVSMDVIRVAFPKYVERPVYFKSSTITLDGQRHPLQLMEDVSKVAFKCLDERMALEFSKALLRVAIKKLSEYEMRKSNRNMGDLMTIVNAITERADTRNWQTLPHSILYARIPLKPGRNEITFSLEPVYGSSQEHAFTYDVKPGQTLFHTFSSLEIGYPTGRF